MAECESVEADWLAQMYGRLVNYEGRDLTDTWVAVVGERIVDVDVDPVALAMRVTERHGEGRALFASVVPGPLA